MLEWYLHRAFGNVARTAPAALLAAFVFLVGEPACADLLRDRMEVLAGSSTPVEIQADRAEYDRKTGVYTATGNVVITQGDTVLTADEASLETATGLAEAKGRVTLTDKDNVLLAERASVNFDTSLGVIEKGSIFVKKENYHIEGERLERVSENEYRVSAGSLTTCDAATPFWRFTAEDIKVRMDKDVQARDVVMRIMDVPVLYTPYAWFPLLKPRTTGFMIPGFGYSTDDGVRLYNSFYWAPLDNFDATVDVDYRSERGVGLSTELRLALDRTSSTRFYGYYMDDRKDLSQRYNIEFQHRQILVDRLAIKADIHLSDRNFFKDLAETTEDRTKRSTDSNIFITNAWDNSLAYLFGQYTLDLDITRNKEVTVQRLPEAGFDLSAKKLGDTPLYLDFQGSGAFFYREAGVQGGRFDLYPKLTGAFNLGGVMLLPRVGYRETFYNPRGKDRAAVDEERGLFGSGATVQTELSRLYTLGGGALKAVKHTIEPKVAYNYVLVRGGSRFPNFDGIDTLGRRSMVAYSLTNRFVFKYEGSGGVSKLDYLTIKLGQFYDFYKDNKVLGINRSFSCLYGEVVYMSAYGMTLNADFRYNVYTGKVLSVNTDIEYRPKGGDWHLLLGHRLSSDTDQTFMSPSRFDFFTPSTDFMSDFAVAGGGEREKVDFLLFGAGAKLPANLTASGKVWYDVHSDTLRETDLSVRYDSQCWAVAVSYVKRPGEQQYLAVFEFKGLGTVKI